MRAGSAGAFPTMSSTSPTWTPSRRSSPASPGVRHVSNIISLRDHDLPETAASLEMTIGRVGLGKRECPIDHGTQTVQRDRPVHGLKIRADRAEGNAAAGRQ